MQGTFPVAARRDGSEMRSSDRSPPARLLRDAARRALYRTGLLPLYHLLFNRRTLTVVVFHRVLRSSDPRWRTALVPWTLSDGLFERCLEFFKRHYTVVTLRDVKASLKRMRSLPPCSLLITFDDGFADNNEYALPLLRKHGVSATIFISSDVIGREKRLWTEDLLWAFVAGRVHQRELASLHALLFDQAADAPDDPSLIWDIVRRGPALDETRVEAALAALQIGLDRTESPRQMLTAPEIANLLANGISVGSHGKTHTALPFAADLATELFSPRAVLSDVAASQSGEPVDTFSFPHGAYTSEIIAQALAGGYTLLFTNDAGLCVLEDGFLLSPVIGRIDVDRRRIAPTGRFWPEMLATTCFMAARGGSEALALRERTEPTR